MAGKRTNVAPKRNPTSASCMGNAYLYFLVIEGMYTFWRTVRRVSFFFSGKLSLGAEPTAEV